MATILIVDDNPTNRSFLVTLLGYSGHELLEAADGLEALNLVVAHKPDLVIADILMPTMDGFEFVRGLRVTPEVAHTPVIFCTAHFHERDAKDLARECGVARVLTKPCEPETVLQAVGDCLGMQPAVILPPQADTFDREHLRLLMDKLSQKADELTAASLRQQALLDFSVQLASEGHPGNLLDKFCHAARDLVACRYSLVGVPSENNKRFIHLSAAGIEIDPRGLLRASNGLFANVMESRLPLSTRNPGGDPASLGLPATLRPFDSLLVAPIVSPTRTYGWLCLFHRLGAAEFTQEDERLAGVFAALVGRVYENASLNEKTRRHAGELERHLKERKDLETQRENLISQLQRALEEKTVLLREVHHRVRNNLAVIVSLVRKQASTVTDEVAAQALMQTQQRIQSMALIHQHLYGTENLKCINFGKYAEQFSTQIATVYGTAQLGIEITVLADPVELSVDQAIPCGLILNELLSNAVKHAFPAGRGGEIEVRLEDRPGGRLTLSCSDNGVGIPESLDWKASKTMGITIALALTKQLSGTLELVRNCGTRFELRFKRPVAEDREQVLVPVAVRG